MKLHIAYNDQRSIWPSFTLEGLLVQKKRRYVYDINR